MYNILYKCPVRAGRYLQHVSQNLDLKAGMLNNMEIDGVYMITFLISMTPPSGPCIPAGCC